MIDFGLSKGYKDPINYSHIPYSRIRISIWLYWTKDIVFFIVDVDIDIKFE